MIAADGATLAPGARLFQGQKAPLAHRPDDPATERKRGEGPGPLTSRTADGAFPFLSVPMGLRPAKLDENRAGAGEREKGSFPVEAQGAHIT